MSRLRHAAVALTACCLVAAGPPPTPTVDRTETLFGMTFADPYYWMEQGGAAFDTWLTAQAAYTRSVLDAIPGRAAMLERLRSLDGGEIRVGGTVRAGDMWFFSKTRPGDAVGKIFLRGPDGVEHVLIDPAPFDAGGNVAGIDYWSVAPDGRHVAYGVSLGGAEIGVLRVRSVQTGADLPEAIDRTRYARPTWVGNDSFLYSRLGIPASGGEPDYSAGQVLLHRLGTDPAADTPVFSRGSIAEHDLPADLLFRGLASPDSAMMLGEVDFGLISSPRGVFTTARANAGPGAVWRQVAGLDDGIRGVVLHQDMIYLRTVEGAARQRIVRVSAIDPDLARAETVVPEQAGTITAMAAGADALYVQFAAGGRGGLLRLPWDGVPETLTLPFAGAIIGLSANAATPGAVVRMQGWARSPTVFAYDPATQRFTDTGIAPPSPVSFADIEAIDSFAPAADGALVPVTIVAPRGAVRDGSHPVLLFSYGAYGVPIDPTFNPARRAWFDHGGIFVIAHVRGSGGFGADWHRAGQLENKTNSVSDFIAAAEYLVRTGWASPSGLGIMGGSAGGIVMGGAITARPDLFSAAIIEVGLLNTLRLEQIPIGPFNTGEFGSTETEDGVRMLRAIDAYQQIRDSTAHPGVLIATGRRDTRVSAWMPAKFAARLQATNAGANPVLLRVDDFGGHAATSKQQAAEELADYYAFLLSQAGVAGFVRQP